MHAARRGTVQRLRRRGISRGPSTNAQFSTGAAGSDHPRAAGPWLGVLGDGLGAAGQRPLHRRRRRLEPGAGRRYRAAPRRLPAPQSTIDNAGTARFDAGFAGLASLGWGFGNGIRAEIEGNYRENDVNAIGGFDLSPFVGIQGKRAATAPWRSFYDIDLARFGVAGSPVTPISASAPAMSGPNGRVSGPRACRASAGSA